MKTNVFLILLFVADFAAGQTNKNSIDSSNYYNYYSNGKDIKGMGVTTAWLQRMDVVPIIEEELINEGYQDLGEFALYKMDSTKYIVLTIYCRESNFGFLYLQGHYAFPKKEHRQQLTQRKERGVDYIICEDTYTGKPNYIKIPELPKNIFVLNENCYWYQYTDDIRDDNNLVTKEIAIKILRQDIKARLANAPKPAK